MTRTPELTGVLDISILRDPVVGLASGGLPMGAGDPRGDSIEGELNPLPPICIPEGETPPPDPPVDRDLNSATGDLSSVDGDLSGDLRSADGDRSADPLGDLDTDMTRSGRDIAESSRAILISTRSFPFPAPA